MASLINSGDFNSQNGQIRDPKNGQNVSFSQAVQRGFIDENSFIYDTDLGKALTLKEAMQKDRIQK